MYNSLNHADQNLEKTVELLAAQLEAQSQELIRLRSLIKGKKRGIAFPKRLFSSLPMKAISLSFVFLMLFSTIAVASIPSSSGVITACYINNKGDLRVIDPATTACSKSETQITWSQQGASGTGVDPNLICLGCNKQGFNLSGANLIGAYLPQNKLNDANLSQANLSSASLTTSDLSGANLTNAIIHNANFEFVNLTNSNLSGADIIKTYASYTFFSNTICPDGTNSNNDPYGNCMDHGWGQP